MLPPLPYLSSKATELFLALTFVLALRQDITSANKRDNLIVTTDKGDVRGVRYYLRQQEKVIAAYLGIPFAQPPLGHLRFKHPQHIDRWEGIYNATSPPNSCYHDPDVFFGDFYGATMWNSPTKVSEDCLYLNVWVPKTHPKLRKAAVLVWIYGGGFYSGTTTLKLYDGKFLAAENNVIVVSIGYRVGPLGYLSLNEEAPGNAGMFDQLMGLQWIQKNIKRFGGDPNNVTIFGESAGAVSVSLHLLSPLSHSLFQRAIMQSGSAVTPWATLSKEQAKERALTLATKYLGCPASDNMDDILYCLRELPAQRLIDEQWISRGVAQFPFVPVVDGSFLIETPEMSLKRRSFKKCPIIVGTNKDEGSFFIIYELYQYLNLNKIEMNREQFLHSIDHLFLYYPQYPTRATDLGREAIAYQYSNWLDPSDKIANVIQLSNAVGDSHFACPVNQFAHAYASAGESVYYFHFTERYRSNPWPEWMGVLHGDEVLFAFGEPLKPGLNFTQAEKDLTKKMMKFWTNFAKSADPNRDPASGTYTQEWPLHGPDDKYYLELNSKFLDEPDKSKAIGRGPRARECAFWLDYLPQLLAASETCEAQPPTSAPTDTPATPLEQVPQHPNTSCLTSSASSMKTKTINLAITMWLLLTVHLTLVVYYAG